LCRSGWSPGSAENATPEEPAAQEPQPVAKRQRGRRAMDAPGGAAQ
jgi:hypothetical protein